MFRFANPYYLWLLLILPILAIIYYLYNNRSRKQLERFADEKLISRLAPNISKYRCAIKFWLMEIALSLIILMIARPQIGTKIATNKQNGIETMIALDISNSMLSQDIKPSRLERSKMLIESLMDKFSDDKVGLVVFAGDAFIQLPMTSDIASAKMFLNNIDPSLIGNQGTNISAALNLCLSSFSNKSEIGKAIILITDGEDHEGQAEEMAAKAKKAGVNIFVLGVGTSQGAPIPLSNGKYLTDNTGNTVVTKLNENMCRQIATAGNGIYINVDNTPNGETKLISEINKLQKGEIDGIRYSDFDEQYPAIALIVLFILAIEAFIQERKKVIFENIKFFSKDKK